MPHIIALVDELAQFQRNNPSHLKVSEAMGMVHKVLYRHKSELLWHRVVVTYHGSLLYNDPRNLDLDLGFTTSSEVGLLMNENYIQDIMDEFEALPTWPIMGHNNGHCDTNFVWFSIEGIQNDVAALEAGRLVFDNELDMLDINASALLTSPPLFPEQAELLYEFIQHVYQLLEGSLILRRVIARPLEEAVAIRKERSLLIP